MAAVKAAVSGSKAAALRELCSYATAPPATLHVLAAVLRLLRRDGATFATWNAAVRHTINEALFEELEGYDAEQDRDMEVWKGVRAAYKAVDKDVAWGKWTYESPESAIGALLMLYIKQVWRHRRSCAAVMGGT